VLAALGPLGGATEFLEDATLLKFFGTESLVVSFQATSSGDWLVSFVAHVKLPIPADGLLTKLPGAVSQGEAGKKYWVAGERAYYLPEEREGKVLVVAPTTLIADIVDSGGASAAAAARHRRRCSRTPMRTSFDADRRPISCSAKARMFAATWRVARGRCSGFSGDGLSGGGCR
jgi:hypothetical protein